MTVDIAIIAPLNCPLGLESCMGCDHEAAINDADWSVDCTYEQQEQGESDEER